MRQESRLSVVALPPGRYTTDQYTTDRYTTGPTAPERCATADDRDRPAVEPTRQPVAGPHARHPGRAR